MQRIRELLARKKELGRDKKQVLSTEVITYFLKTLAFLTINNVSDTQLVQISILQVTVMEPYGLVLKGKFSFIQITQLCKLYSYPKYNSSL